GQQLLRRAPVVGEVAVAPPGRRYARGVVEVIVPQRVQAESSFFDGIELFRALRLVLADQNDPARRGLGTRPRGDLRGDVRSRGIEEALDRIETQSVEVKLPDPVRGVFDDELANGPAHRAIEVDRLAPFVAITIREVVRTEVRQIVSIGA